MKRRYLLVVAVLLVAVFAFVACEHVHTYEEKWSYNESGHWHAVTCGHDDAVEIKPHSMKAVDNDANKLKCESCDYVETKTAPGPTPDPTPNPNPTPDPDSHKHTFATDWTSDATHHWHSAKCEHTTEVSDKGAHTYQDGICSVCGAWSSVSDVLLAVASKLEIWNYTLQLNEISIPDYSGSVSTVVSGEITVSLNKDGELSGKGNLKTVIPEIVGEGVNATEVDSVINILCVLQDGVLYGMAVDIDSTVEATGRYVRFDMDDILANYGTSQDAVKKVLAELDANTQTIREAVTEIAKALDGFKVDDATVKAIVNKLFTANADKTVYTLKFDALEELNEILATNTVADYIDAILGEGAFAKLPETVEGIFDMTIESLLTALEAKGVTVDEVIAIVNSAIDKYYPDQDVKTLVDLIKTFVPNLPSTIVTEKDIITMLKPMKVGEIVEAIFSSDGKEVTQEQILAQITAICDAYKDMTAYDFVILAMSNAKNPSDPSDNPSLPDNDDNVTANDDIQGEGEPETPSEPSTPQAPAYTANGIKLVVSNVVAILKDHVTFTAKVNGKVIEQIALTVVAPVVEDTPSDPSDTPSDPADEEPATPTADEQMAMGIDMMLRGILADLEIDVALTKDYTSKVDYSKVVDTVKGAFAQIVIPETLDETQIQTILANSHSVQQIEHITSKNYANGVLTVVGYNDHNGIRWEIDENTTYSAIRRDNIVVAIDLTKFNILEILCKDKASVEVNEMMTYTQDDLSLFKTVGEGSNAVVTNYATLDEFLAQVPDESDRPIVAEAIEKLGSNAYGTRVYSRSLSIYVDVKTGKIVTRDALRHTLVEVPDKCVVGENCGDVSKIVYKCSVCNKELVAYSEISHNYVEVDRIPVNGNCENGIAVILECEKCHNTESSEGYGHNSDVLQEEVPIDKTSASKKIAITAIKCTVCELVVGDSLEIDGRNWAEWMFDAPDKDPEAPSITCQKDYENKAIGADYAIIVKCNDEVIATYNCVDRM